MTPDSREKAAARPSPMGGHREWMGEGEREGGRELVVLTGDAEIGRVREGGREGIGREFKWPDQTILKCCSYSTTGRNNNEVAPCPTCQTNVGTVLHELRGQQP